jgi:hypothetical protein
VAENPIEHCGIEQLGAPGRIAAAAVRAERGIFPQRRIHEPAPSSVIIEPNGLSASEVERGATEVGAGDVDAGQDGIDWGGLPTMNRVGQQCSDLLRGERCDQTFVADGPGLQEGRLQV